MEVLQQRIIHNGITNQMKEEENDVHKRWEYRFIQEEKIK